MDTVESTSVSRGEQTNREIDCLLQLVITSEQEVNSSTAFMAITLSSARALSA